MIFEFRKILMYISNDEQDSGKENKQVYRIRYSLKKQDSEEFNRREKKREGFRRILNLLRPWVLSPTFRRKERY